MTPQFVRWCDRYFFLVAGLLLAAMAGAQIGSAIQESPTNDEPVHLTAGYVYLTTGEYSMDLSHPPLARMMAALPLLSLPLKRIPPERAWPELQTLIWGNQISADTILLRARMVTIALTVLLGAWLALWTRRRFSSPVALLALTFFAFDPTLIAHGHYVTTDLVATLGIFLTCTLWADFLDSPNWKRLVMSALALGFALASKFSAVFLLPVLTLLYLVAWWRKRDQPFFTWRGSLATCLVMGAGAALFIALPYLPDLVTLREHGHDTSLLSIGYFQGLRDLGYHDATGISSYLFGHFRKHGWWQYFPIAFLVKTPTGILAACLIAIASLWLVRRRFPTQLPLFCLALPPLAYFALALHSAFNIGVRHILPIYPFLYVLLAFVLMEYGPLLLKRAWRGTIIALALLVAAESISIYPHYLAFFNWASGGPNNGSRYLLDSNIDWGQDLKSLGTYVNNNHMTPLCTALFGAAPAGYYGITARDLNQTGMPEGVANLPCVVAVSVNVLRGLYNSPQKFAALRAREPLARIGYSIYVYDLRR